MREDARLREQDFGNLQVSQDMDKSLQERYLAYLSNISITNLMVWDLGDSLARSITVFQMGSLVQTCMIAALRSGLRS